MGLFGSSQPSGPATKLSADGTPEAPNRSARQHCWDARDAFFRCLDRHNIVDSLKDDTEAKKVCGAEHQVFEKNCASTWVSFFLSKL